AQLASASALPPWARLVLCLSDATGAPLQNVSLRAEVNGTEVGSGITAASGGSAWTGWTAEGAVDICACTPTDLDGWQMAVSITQYAEQTKEWKLGPATHLAGRMTALDRRTPMPSVVVELVQLEGAESTSPEMSKQSAPPTRGPEISRQGANRVLRLDGK